jgi:hypothetical protein
MNAVLPCRVITVITFSGDNSHPFAQDEVLGRLAMRYRRVQNRTDRIQIAKDYAETVNRLIQSGVWHNAPRPEDQLPDDDMPKAFFEYWTR